MTHQIVVRQYGLLPPLDWDADCDQQMRLMNEFWNRLVELHNSHKEAFRLLTAEDPEVIASEAKLAAIQLGRQSAIDERKAARKAARKKVATPELDKRIAELSKNFAVAAEIAKGVRKKAREKIIPKIKALAEEHKLAVKAARQKIASEGLWWSNYNAVLASYDAARQRAIKTGGELHFRRYDGSGRLVNQIQADLSTEDLFAGKHPQVKVAPFDVTIKGRRHGRTTLTATVFARGREYRKNVTWPMVMHRPLPEGVNIQSVAITKRKVAHNWEWSVTFTGRVEGGIEPHKSSRACGIDVGWRRMNDGLRVATIVTSDRHVDYLILPNEVLHLHQVASDQQAERDKMANDQVAFIRSLNWETAPAELAEASHGIRSATRVGPRAIARLVFRWRADHAHWKPDALATLIEWEREDRHIWRSHAGLVLRLTRRRRDIYRVKAAELTTRHGIIGVEDIDIRKMLASKIPEPLMESPQRAMARLAAPGEFLLLCKQAAVKRGCRFHEHSGKSTWVCSNCGTESQPANPSDLHHTCPHCLATWDQDVNAARNILVEAMAADQEDAVSEDIPLAPRWQRSKKAKEPEPRQKDAA